MTAVGGCISESLENFDNKLTNLYCRHFLQNSARSQVSVNYIINNAPQEEIIIFNNKLS